MEPWTGLVGNCVSIFSCTPPKDMLVLDIMYPMFWDQPNVEFFF